MSYVTKRIKREKRLNKLTGKMNKQPENRLLNETKMVALGGLSGGIAHEFNNVLAVVSGNLKLIIEMFGDEINDEMRSMMDDALASAEKGAQITSGLLALSRPQETDTRLINVNEFVRNFADLFKLTVSDDINIKVEFENDERFVLVDESGLSTALLQLALNARRAMSGGGQLTIRTSSGVIEPHAVGDDQSAEAVNCEIIEVSDTGCGMSAAVLDQATDAFFTTKNAEGGSGLGLSIITDFVKTIEGDLRITSVPGEGTTIAIYMPV